MNIEDLTQYVTIVQPLGWLGFSILFLFLFHTPIFKIFSGIGKRINGNMDENHSKRLEKIETNDIHEFREFRNEMKEFRKEVRESMRKHDIDIARLLTKVFNGEYRR